MRFLQILLVLLLFSPQAAWADERIGSFVILDDVEDAILLDGDITYSSPLDFRRALHARPDAKIVLLNSSGGLVVSALILADDIDVRGMSTAIPTGFGCYSACAFLFLAGEQRLVEGELGVHQVSSETLDAQGAQYAVSDIFEMLDRFGTPAELITRMFRTRPEDIYVFDQAEIEAMALNRTGKGFRPPSVAIDTKETAPLPEPTIPTDFGLRIAVYEGLDFYGADISNGRTEDAVQCAVSCLGDNACVAFTFNANPNLTRGPNCFLKSGSDRLEAYRDAFSGLLLDPTLQDAPVFRFGAIDPLTDIRRGVDYPGGDLSQSPWPQTTSLEGCRLACLGLDACIGFTFVSQPKQCWLKSSLGAPQSRADVISGIKTFVSFNPVDVISLED